MKKLCFLLLFITCCFNTIKADVIVDATNFPDDAFRAWVLQNVKGAEDGFLSDTEINDVKEIIITGIDTDPQYLADYVIVGIVTFSAENVEVKASDEMLSAHYQDRTFTPNYTNREGDEYLALNVNNYYVTNPSTEIDGSKFIKGLRAVHPFEAYMTTTSNTRSIDVMDSMTTAIRGILMVKDETSTIMVYDTKGLLLKSASNMDDVRNGLKSGVYIVNGKKMVIK